MSRAYYRPSKRLRQTLSQREALGAKHQAVAKYIDSQKSIHKLWAMRDEDVAVLLDFKEILFFEADDKRVNAKVLSGRHVASALHHA